MDDHIRKLDTKIQSKETELNALFTKIQKLEEEIATLYQIARGPILGPLGWGGETPGQQNDTGEKQNETALMGW